MTLPTGSKLGPYEILALLGAGGMGEVYRARDTRLGREVAVKVLPTSFSQDADRLWRFEQEARAASALNHPNILTVYDVGDSGGSPYVVCELLEGQTLRERLSTGPLSTRRTVEDGFQIAAGLAAAHEKGIVHRDLKPENVFLMRDGRVKILDFGLAKLTQPEIASVAGTQVPTLTPTEPGFVLGTVGYMSPEQVRGEPADPRSDIFSLGATLYEMLTGRRAFGGSTAVETLHAILKEEPPDPVSAGPGIPPALDRVVRRCLEKNPSERFQSARDLGFALREASGGVAASGASAVVEERPPRRLLAAALAIGLIALVAALVLSNVGGLRDRLRSRPGAPASIQSIAVLPLENFSKDPEQEYFADGMTEELITNLAQIGSLRVISRTSTMRYKGTRKSVPEIARELGVDGVLEGSVQRAGNRVRVTAQLIDASTDRHLWAKSYERELKDVLSLQGEVAQSIAGEVGVRLTPQERSRLGERKPVDAQAYDAYLKGLFHMSRSTAADTQESLRLFQQAVEKQPDYALAWAGIGNAYQRLASSAYGVQAPKEGFPKARAAAAKAEQLDPSLAEAQAVLGWCSFVFDWDWTAAERRYRRALELNPSFADAHRSYTIFLLRMGRFEEAIDEAKRAQTLDPLSLEATNNVGLTYHFARRDDEAQPWLRRVLALDPNFWRARWGLGLVLVQKQRLDEAIAELRRSVDLSGTGGVQLGALGYALAAAGRQSEAVAVRDQLEALSQRQYQPPSAVALVLTGMGEKQEATAWLERAAEERDPWATHLKIEPMFDSLRSEPRFQSLVRRVGLP